MYCRALSTVSPVPNLSDKNGNRSATFFSITAYLFADIDQLSHEGIPLDGSTMRPVLHFRRRDNNPGKLIVIASEG